MKIKALKTFLVPPRWLFLKIETDEGICGWGEPVVEGRAHTVQTAVEELADRLIGADPLRIEDLWQIMYRGGFYRGGPILMSAIAGIDQALWDIKGRAYGQPVHQLLGGPCRDRIRIYSWIGGDRPEDVAANARAAVANGFTALKMNGAEEMQIVDGHHKIDHIVETIGAVRDAVGPHVGLGVDFHGRVQRPMAKILIRELEQFRLMFIEEPVLSENLDALAEVIRNSSTPIALGERLYSRWDFKQVFESRVADIIQPDLSHAGGITECRKIAAMAEAYDVALAPHCPLGPIALASCLHVDAVSHNAFIQEQSLGIHYNNDSDLLDYLADRSVFAYKDGMVEIPQGPGLGIEIDEDAVIRAAETGHRWRSPLWRHRDGSVAEW
ncbi:galactonate dehydratase [Chelativorans sp. AA-79]|uniref:galactonate dehydratase n=1 Tax=Chelativorans sp. AA-79 TaxID=3028735 RepID=UPI0023F9F130|nr:galactonate dehydratase [Chelativorans sp. AA-79]WEX08998.1 galactonate dehydratase [Chelativorans sp. AA-79]